MIYESFALDQKLGLKADLPALEQEIKNSTENIIEKCDLYLFSVLYLS